MDRTDVMSWARSLVDASDGRLELVYEPEDTGHFLTFGDQRIGGVIEAYGYAGETQEPWGNILADLLAEVLTPVKENGLSRAYRVGADGLKVLGHQVWPAHLHSAWDAILN